MDSTGCSTKASSSQSTFDCDDRVPYECSRDSSIGSQIGLQLLKFTENIKKNYENDLTFCEMLIKIAHGFDFSIIILTKIS